MGKFISKSIANEVASKMADKVFGEIILSKQKAYYESVEKVYQKYLPSHVLAIASELGDYFDTSKNVGLFSFDKAGCRKDWLFANISFPVPTLKQTIEISFVDYEEVTKARVAYEKEKRKRDDLANRLSEIFMSLRSFKLIRERFPESIPFFDQYDIAEKKLPMVPFDDIRDLFKLP